MNIQKIAKNNILRLSLAVFGVLAGLLFVAVHLYPTSADDLPVVYKSGTLSQNETWSAGSVYVLNSSGVEVPSGITLTIEPGAIIKIQQNSYGITVLSGGTLNATAAASNPIIFTSYKDDSVGGDSNGDGTSTLPARNDYYGAITTGGGNISVHFCTFEYAFVGVGGMESSGLEVTDSNFANDQYGISLNSVSPVLLRNIFDMASVGTYAIEVMNDNNLSTISLNGINENIFTNPKSTPSMNLGHGYVPQGSTWELSPSSAKALQVNDLNIQGYMTVNGGVLLSAKSNSWSFAINDTGTLILQPGAVIKYEQTEGISVSGGGVLSAVGTSAMPVTFTSYRDDTIGGDTNGDGLSTPSVSDYGFALLPYDGTVNIDHANFNYAVNSIVGSGEGSVAITNSEFNNTRMALSLNNAKDLSLSNNVFDVQGGESSAVSISNLADVTNIILEGTNENHFTGDNRNITLGKSTIPSGKNWSIDGSSGAIFKTNYENTINGTFNITNTPMILTTGFSWFTALDVNGVLNLQNIPWIKIGNNQGIEVLNGGQLHSNSALNAIITSYKDDSVGGDSNGDGPSSGARGDYATAIIEDQGATIDLSNVTLKYGGTGFILSGTTQLSNIQISDIYKAFDISSGNHNLLGISVNNATAVMTAYHGNAIFRGSVQNISGRAITACAWETSNCTVDAAYTDWSNVNGPFANDPAVCGKVTVSPWLNGSSMVNSGVFDVKDCDNSPTLADQLSSSVVTYQGRIDNEKLNCSQGQQDACQQIERTINCVNAAVGLASYNSPFPLPGSSPTDAASTFIGDYTQGANTYMSGIEESAPTTFTLGAIDGLASILNVVSGLTTAYSTCN